MSERSKKDYIKIIFSGSVLVSVLAFWTWFCIFGGGVEETEDFEPKELEVVSDAEDEIDRDIGVPAWLQYYLNGEWGYCDTLVPADGFKFQGYEWEHGITAHLGIYDEVLRKSVMAVDNVTITKVTRVADSEAIYEISVVCHPYKEAKDFNPDMSEYESLNNDFVGGKLSSSEYETAVTALFWSWLDSLYVLDTNETLVLTFEMRELRDRTSGLTEVVNTEKFIGEVFKTTGVLDVEKYFEDNLEDKLHSVLEVFE